MRSEPTGSHAPSWVVGLVSGLALAALALPARAQHAHHGLSSRADGHAPIGVMGDHTHAQGEWMLSYRYMFMSMEGHRDGRSDRSVAEVLASFPVSPTKMTMEMHMLGLMYAPSDELTLVGMLPLLRLTMDHQNAMGRKFRTKSQGVGDVKLSALYRLRRTRSGQLQLNLGVSLPTGTISEKDGTPAGRVRLPYPMQLGSGTFGLLPGLTYVGHAEDWSWGAQTIAAFQLGQNRHDYTLGNQLSVTTWLARSWRPQLSTSLRLDGRAGGNIHGADSRLVKTMVPTADPDRRGGRRVDLALGVNWFFRRGPLKGHRLAAELAWPLYQWLDGPQLETDWTLTLGWQRAF